MGRKDMPNDDIERVLREHFKAEASDLLAPGDPWNWLESRLSPTPRRPLLGRLLGTRRGRLYAVSGATAMFVVAIAAAWTVAWTVVDGTGDDQPHIAMLSEEPQLALREGLGLDRPRLPRPPWLPSRSSPTAVAGPPGSPGSPGEPGLAGNPVPPRGAPTAATEAMMTEAVAESGSLEDPEPSVEESKSVALTRIHRGTALGTALEEGRGCSSESGIMVLEQKPARKQGAPNRCCHRTIPTASASSLTTTAWWPMPDCSFLPPSPSTWACGNSSTITLTSAARRDGRTRGTRC